MSFSLSNIFASLQKQTTSKPNRVVGIDIGSSSIKVVELEKTERALTLRTYGELQLGPYAQTDLGSNVSLSEQVKAAALIDLIREANVKATSGVLAMPLAASFVTVISLTLGEKDDIATKIPVVARKYIPVPMSDVVLDWLELPPLGKTKEGDLEVLLAAIQTESFTEFSNLMRAVKMTSEPSEIEVFSTIRALNSSKASTMAIIDLGSRVSKLYIARDGTLERIHRVTTGGEAITKKIAALREVSFIEAENLKRNVNSESEHAGDVRKATQAVLEAPLQEFKRIIDIYETRLGHPLGSVTLVGGVAAGFGISELATDVLVHEVTRSNPFSHVAYPAFMDDTLKELGPVFAASLGAAMRPLQE